MNNEASILDTHPDIDHRHAIIVLPAQSICRDVLQSNRHWLARGQWSRLDDGMEPLATVLAELRIARIPTGLAALRMWGQTGERPEQWLAAADPVYMEALLDHVRVHAVRREEIAGNEMSDLLAFINAELPDEAHKFLHINGCAYLQGGAGFDTASCSSECIDGLEPGDYLPIGMASREHDRLNGELQLLLYDAHVNRIREADGRLPVNSFWFWGGGTAPESRELKLPLLVGNDALFRGFWNSCGSRAAEWPDASDWHKLAPSAFIAVVPPHCESAPFIGGLLSFARRQLLRGKIRRLSILYGNRFLLRLGRTDLFAFWRTRPLLPLESDSR